MSNRIQMNPWAGLSSYQDPETADVKLKFCGRDDESFDVAQLIDDNVFVTLYGKSGTGKTSLLNAGVFPRLRQEQYLPISIRLGMEAMNISFQQCLLAKLAQALQDKGIRTSVDVVPLPSDDQATEYLWSYFARTQFIANDGRVLFPVLVFDQFEEAFRDRRSDVETLLRQIYFMMDGNHALSDRMIGGQLYQYNFNFRFVVSIREDDLYRLEDSIDNCYLSELKRCRYRLHSLSEQGARDAILIPGEGLFLQEEQDEVVKAIIDKSKNVDGSISTNIISLLCSSIYADFQQSKANHMTKSLVESFIKGNPFERFYNEATRGFSNREKSYIEDHLVDSTGRRNSVPESDFLLHVPKAEKLLEGNASIIQRTSTSSDGGNYRIELIHDSFCDPLVGQKVIRKQRRRIRMFAIVALAICCALGGVWVYENQMQKANLMTKAIALIMKTERARMYLEQGDSYSARVVLLDIFKEDINDINTAYLPMVEAVLRDASIRNSAVLKGHIAALNGAKYSSDGKRLVTCSYDGTLKMWDAMSGKCLKTFIGHKYWVMEVDFCANEDNIISYSLDGTVKIWNVSSGEIVRSFEVERLNGKSDFGFWLSPNKRLLIMRVKGVLSLYDASSFEQIKPFKETEMWCELCWYPDNKWLSVYTYNNELIRVNVYTNQRLFIAKNNDDASLVRMSVDPKGELVAGAFGYDNRPGYAAVWDVKTGRRVLKLQGEENWVNGVTFSSDSKKIVTTSMDGPVRIWDASSGACLDIMKGHPFASGSPLFSPDGKCIVTESADATARFWDVPGIRDSMGLFLVGQKYRSAAYIKEGKELLVASYDSLCLYDVVNKVWKETLYKHDSIMGADVSPKGDVISLRLANKNFVLLDMSTKKARMLQNIKEAPYSVSFTPDGKYLVFATEDSVIHVHEVASGKQLQTIRRHNRVNGVMLVDNERRMVVVEDSTMSVLSSVDTQDLKTWSIPKSGYVMQLSPDGKHVLVGIESSIYVWELATGKCISTLAGHTSRVYACCFSPDGKYVVSTSHDTMVKLWDWRSGVCLQSECLRQYISAKFSPDGRHVVVLSRSGNEVRIMDYPPLQELIDKTRERFKNRQLTPEERRNYYLE